MKIRENKWKCATEKINENAPGKTEMRQRKPKCAEKKPKSTEKTEKRQAHICVGIPAEKRLSAGHAAYFAIQ